MFERFIGFVNAALFDSLICKPFICGLVIFQTILCDRKVIIAKLYQINSWFCAFTNQMMRFPYEFGQWLRNGNELWRWSVVLLESSSFFQKTLNLRWFIIWQPLLNVGNCTVNLSNVSISATQLNSLFSAVLVKYFHEMTDGAAGQLSAEY